MSGSEDRVTLVLAMGDPMPLQLRLAGAAKRLATLGLCEVCSPPLRVEADVLVRLDEVEEVLGVGVGIFVDVWPPVVVHVASQVLAS